MLKEIIRALSGSATSTAFSSPYGQGYNVPASATFGKLFKGLTGSLNDPFTNGGLPQGAGIMGPVGGQGQPQDIGSALQAFRNAQSGINDPTPTLRNQAFAPGAVLINSNGLPVIQNTVPQQQASFQGFAPLQGFAGQGAINQNGGQQFPQQNQFFQPQPGFAGNVGGGGLGAFQFLLSPIFGIFGALKALFGMRREILSQNPIIVNKENIGYHNFQNYLGNEYVPGGFDEPGAYEGKGFAENADFNRLSEF